MRAIFHSWIFISFPTWIEQKNSIYAKMGGGSAEECISTIWVRFWRLLIRSLRRKRPREPRRKGSKKCRWIFIWNFPKVANLSADVPQQEEHRCPPFRYFVLRSTSACPPSISSTRGCDPWENRSRNCQCNRCRAQMPRGHPFYRPRRIKGSGSRLRCSRRLRYSPRRSRTGPSTLRNAPERILGSQVARHGLGMPLLSNCYMCPLTYHMSNT